MRAIRKSALLLTSSQNDVQRSGRSLNITGLDSINFNFVRDIKQIKYKAEVSQVVTVGASSYTPTASTLYKVEIVDVQAKREGFTGRTHVYGYLTPPVITTIGSTAALQREFIHLAIIAKINADTGANHAVAASLLTGTGFTITDTAGYFPANTNGGSGLRKGANQIFPVTNSDGTGFVAGDVSLTTAAVYSFGDGTKLNADTPIVSAYFQNLVQGSLQAPVTIDNKYATAGQFYDAFVISSLTIAAAHAVSDQFALVPQEFVVFVDNGTGAATTNAAGFATFQRAMLREIFALYKGNVKAMTSTFDSLPTYATLTGLSVIPTTALAENTIDLGEGTTLSFTPSIIATSAAVAMPIIDTTVGGLNLAHDAASGKGSELSAHLSAKINREYIIGKDVFSLYTRIYVDDVSGVNPMLAGFRVKAAYAAAVATNTDYAAIGIIGTAATQKIQTATQVASGGQTTTDTTKTWADTETHELETRVDIGGNVTWYVDGQQVLAGTAYAFAAAAVVIPFVVELQTADVAANVNILELASLPTNYWRI